MILVIGHALAKPDTLQAMLAISVEHVLRSRAEPGCISHEVTTDAQQPLRLTFVERWSDMGALQALLPRGCVARLRQGAGGHGRRHAGDPRLRVAGDRPVGGPREGLIFTSRLRPSRACPLCEQLSKIALDRMENAGIPCASSARAPVLPSSPSED